MRFLRSLAIAGGILAMLPAWASAGPTITEFSGLQSDPGPWGITAGPDGNVWFTEKTRPAIGRISPSGEITEFGDGLSGSDCVMGITAGPDGNVWFTVTGGSTAIGRITPSGDITTFSIGLSLGSEPYDIVAGPDGNLWFTDHGVTGGIGRITPDGVVTEFSVGLTPNGGPESIAAGPDGNLWFTESDKAGIGRITPEGVITEFTTGLTGAEPFDIAAGPDGNLWFTERDDTGRIGRITTSGTITEFDAGLTPYSEPWGITAGPDGNLWFTEHADPGRIGRITPEGEIAEFEAGLTEALAPFGIAAGYGAQMWFTENANPGGIGRITLYLPDGSPKEHRPVQEPHIVTDAFAPTVPVVAPPVIGERVVASGAKGTVRIRRPGSARYTVLAADASLPVGSLVDATHGTVRLVSARDTSGRTQTGTFGGGIFEVRQSRSGRGMTDILLRGGSFGDCRSGTRSKLLLARGAGKRPKRKLWAKDKNGRFRTHGRNSIATVRGTRWLTVDTCDATLTRVTEGKVLVRDLRARKSVLVAAGHGYRARSR